MVRALSLTPLAFISSCAVDLGIEGMTFRCESDSHCASGFSCDREARICVEPSDASLSDAGFEPCGFDEEFDRFQPDDWQENGHAVSFPGFVQLTPAASNQRGTLWYRHRIDAERFSYEMAFNITGAEPEGGDGMALAWVMEDASAIGGSTANLGVYGLDGYLVELDTFPNTGLGDPPSEHVSFARTRGKLLPELEDRDRLGTTSNLGSLRGRDERVLRVDFDRGEIEIFLDGNLVLSSSTADYQPFAATFGATAATGARSDSHTVHRLTLRCL